MLDMRKAFGPDQNHQTSYQTIENTADLPLSQDDAIQETMAGQSSGDSNYNPGTTAPSFQPRPQFVEPQEPPQPAGPSTQSQEMSFAGTPKPTLEEVVVSWSAPSRPFKTRNRQFYTTVAIIVFLVSLILFFAGQFLPIAVVISVAFLGYVLSSVPPHEAAYKITTFGIRVEDQLYYWEELGRFWFDEKFQQPFLLVEVARFPGRLTIMLGQLTAGEVEEILQEVLLKEKPLDTFFDTSAKWLQEKIPLDSL